MRLLLTTAIFLTVVSPAVTTAAGETPPQTEPLTLTLHEAMARARSRSVEAEVALNQLRSAYWAFRSYRASLMPELSFRGTAPAYHKQYSPYMNQEGSYEFVRNNYLQLNGEVSMTQNIWLTGGKVAVNTSLDFYRQLDGGAYNRFMSIPVAVTLTQPIFGVNTIKWDRKIEPVRYKEAKASFMNASEEVATTAIKYYFSLLTARENKSIAMQNLENSRRLHEVAREMREMGRISKNDLLQMELNVLNAESDLSECESNLKSAMFQLCSFLDLAEGTEILPEIPFDIPEINVSYDDVLQKALDNNPFSLQMARKQLEADYEVARAKGKQREINLFAQIGYTGTDHSLAGGYRSLKDNQVVEIGFEIPLVDWGKRKGLVKVAESNRELVESQVRKQTQDFRQNLFILVERFGKQLRQLQIARRSDEIAAQRYRTNVEAFLLGKISTLDLNDSRIKKDEARRTYLDEIYGFWFYYYQIRSLTLWDYETDSPVESDIEAVLRS